MRKISSVNRDRISNMYVDRKVNINRITNIDRIEAIKPINNNTSTANENYLFYSGSFYDQLRELKDQYKNFYLNQQSLESTLKKFEEETTPQESLLELLTLIDELVKKYNLAICSLKSFEGKLGSHYTHEIEAVISQYQIHLARVGITLTQDLTLSFSLSTAQNNLSFNPDYIAFLFDHKNGLIRRLFNLFRNIKSDFQKTNQSYNSDERSSIISGLLMDKRL